MRHNTIVRRLASAVLASALFVRSVNAGTIACYERPADVIEILPDTTQTTFDAITCYVYRDVMIRMTGTRSPSPDDALILPHAGTDPPTKCDLTRPLQGIKLPTEGMAFDGRVADFLIFEAADPSGTSLLAVFDVRNGRKLFEDSLFKVTAVAMTNGILHLRYDRAVNTNCSFITDSRACWSKLLTSGQIPRGVFPGPPSATACRKRYKSAVASPPDEDPSILSYRATLTLDSKGHANVRPMSGLQCDALP